MITKILRIEWVRWYGRRESIATVVFLLAATIGYGLLLRVLCERVLADRPRSSHLLVVLPDGVFWFSAWWSS